MAKINSQGSSFLLGTIIGGVVGSVTALMLAPKSGREMRGDLANGAKQVGQATAKIAEDVTGKTEEWASKAKHAAGSVIADIKRLRNRNSEASDEAAIVAEAVEAAEANAADSGSAVVTVEDTATTS